MQFHVKMGYTYLLMICLAACNKPIKVPPADIPPQSTVRTESSVPEQLVSFAETLKGTPYKYGSSDPAIGFDCSGFISYVFRHFNLDVPRSSIDFTDKGIEVPLASARRGDLILFTGTNHLERHVGHMGIIVYSTPDSTAFIHSTSGKEYGVTITSLNDYYKNRFVKVIRVFDERGELKL